MSVLVARASWGVAVAVSFAALARDSGVAAQLAACDINAIYKATYSLDGLTCQGETQYAVSLAQMPPTADLPALCTSSACTAMFAALSSTVPTDCLLNTFKLRSDLLDQLPRLCAPYQNGSPETTTPPPSSSLNNNSPPASPIVTPKATEKKEDVQKSTTVRVFTIIGYIIGALVGLCLIFLAIGFVQILLDCLKGCHREIKSCFACCCGSSEKHERVDQHDENTDMVYVDIERPHPTESRTDAKKKTSTATRSTTHPTNSAASSTRHINSTSTKSDRNSETFVQTLLAHEAIRQGTLSLDDIHVGDVINHGAYGQVLRGVFEGEPVAIKRLLPARRNDMKEIATFLEEAKIMTTLQHDNIVRLIGVTYNTAGGLSLRDAMSDLSIVCELMEGGDLRSMLSHADSNNAPTGFHADNLPIAIDIATALTYMHSLKPSAIVHRDLKSKNVLLTRDLHAKLTDFGISRVRADATMTAGVGSFLWMAPEIVFGRRYDEKADVFSFGVLLSELDTHKLPYSQAMEPGSDRKLTEMMIVKMVSEGTLTVSFSENADAEVVELARACVATSALLRPSAETVLRRLVEIGERLTRTKAGAGVSMLEDTNAFSMTTTRRMY